MLNRSRNNETENLDDAGDAKILFDNANIFETRDRVNAIDSGQQSQKPKVLTILPPFEIIPVRERRVVLFGNEESPSLNKESSYLAMRNRPVCARGMVLLQNMEL